MKTLAKNGSLYFLSVILSASLVSCSISSTAIPSPTHTLTFSTPTVSPTVTSSPTSSSERPTSTPTLNPTPTSTPSPVPTPTAPVPTLTASEEQRLVLDLLESNGGCQLPCWWGFTPGETSWEVAERFFVSLAKEIWEHESPQGMSRTIFFDIPQHMSSLNQHYFSRDSTIDRILVDAIPPIRDEQYAYGDDQFTSDLAPYLISQILVTYGEPAQIYLGVDPGTWVPFDLLLFYPEKGILARYSGPSEWDGGATVRVCPYQSEISLLLWSPEDDRMVDFLPYIGSYTANEMSEYASLEDVTEMSIEQFYQAFTQADRTICLETPIDIW